MRITDRFIRAASHPRVDAIAGRLSGATEKLRAALPGGPTTADFLHGKWLGHPLHPVLTDLPIGAWSLAAVFDALSLVDRKLERAAGYAIKVGVAAAVPTAVAGALDWQHTSGQSRRLGASHALLNSAGLACYGASLVCRATGAGPARVLAFAGLGCVAASAYLGGHLVMVSRIGVKHDSAGTPPQESTPAIDEVSLLEGRPQRVEVEGYEVMLLKRAGKVFALADVCPHLGCSLADGEVRDGAIVCPCHGSTFSLADGRVLQGPSPYSVAAFETSIEGDKVRIGPAIELE